MLDGLSSLLQRIPDLEGDRRQFLRFGAFLGGSTVTGSPFLRSVQASEAQESLYERIEGHNVTLRDDFSREELVDIIDVLDTYQSHIGDLRRFNFSIGKEKVNFWTYLYDSNPNSIRYNAGPLRGYNRRGGTDIKSEKNEISVVPKDKLDALKDWLAENGEIPEGEEDKPINFKWTLTHELAHALSYKLGFGHEYRVLFFEPENPSPNYLEHRDLNSQIKDNAKPLGQGEVTSWENKRPEGFPTRYSYFDGPAGGLGEVWADTAAYLLTGSNYADNDSWFMRRVDLVRSNFQEIKETMPSPVNQEQYIATHFQSE